MIPKLKPMHFKPSNEEIEAMPEEVRDALNLEVYHEPTIHDHLNTFADGLEPGTSVNIKDLQLLLWKITGDLESRPLIHAAMSQVPNMKKAKKLNVILYTRK